jgi:hypothetical protein
MKKAKYWAKKESKITLATKEIHREDTDNKSGIWS